MFQFQEGIRPAGGPDKIKAADNVGNLVKKINDHATAIVEGPIQGEQEKGTRAFSDQQKMIGRASLVAKVYSHVKTFGGKFFWDRMVHPETSAAGKAGYFVGWFLTGIVRVATLGIAGRILGGLVALVSCFCISQKSATAEAQRIYAKNLGREIRDTMRGTGKARDKDIEAISELDMAVQKGDIQFTRTINKKLTQADRHSIAEALKKFQEKARDISRDVVHKSWYKDISEHIALLEQVPKSA